MDLDSVLNTIIQNGHNFRLDSDHHYFAILHINKDDFKFSWIITYEHFKRNDYTDLIFKYGYEWSQYENNKTHQK